MTDKNDDSDQLSERIRVTVKKGSTAAKEALDAKDASDAKDESDAAAAQLREAAEVAFTKIKAARAMARKKGD